ncbi:MAG: hypothetical protein DME45_11610, partial [Verrucomicrobia bacterium]
WDDCRQNFRVCLLFADHEETIQSAINNQQLAFTILAIADYSSYSRATDFGEVAEWSKAALC